MVLIDALGARKVNPFPLAFGSEGSEEGAEELLDAAATSGRPRVMCAVCDAINVWLALPVPPAEAIREPMTMNQLTAWLFDEDD
eukprot:jgi/Chrzof1/2889/Cz12g02270.t1